MADIDDELTTADDLDQPLPELKEDDSLPEEPALHSRPLFRILGVVLILLSVVVGVYGTVAYLAWQRSQDAQAQNARTILLEEIEDQLALAREDIAAGNFSLAQRRLDWILEREANHPETLDLKRDIEDQLALPTPTPRPAPTKPAVTEDQGPVDAELSQAFGRLQRLMEDALWSEAITALVEFQTEQPNYRRQETDQFLYDAYINLGQELLSGEQVELGLYYLTQAEALGDLAQEIEDQRLWAELYLLGIAYYGVDWATAISFFRDLCAAAPFYQNSCQKLRESLTALGDVYAANLDWCPAEPLYAEAAQLNGDSVLRDKLANARLMCLEATPTPSAPITATGGISGTLPITPTDSSEDGGQGSDDG